MNERFKPIRVKTYIVGRWRGPIDEIDRHDFHVGTSIPIADARAILEGTLLTAFVNHLLLFEGPPYKAAGKLPPNQLGGLGSVDVIAILTPTTAQAENLCQKYQAEFSYAIAFEDPQ